MVIMMISTYKMCIEKKVKVPQFNYVKTDEGLEYLILSSGTGV